MTGNRSWGLNEHWLTLPRLDLSECLAPRYRWRHPARVKLPTPLAVSRKQRPKTISSEDSMRIVVPKESAPLERRVAMAPGMVKRLVAGGATVTVEAGAGLAASFTDDEYREAGASVTSDSAELFGMADVVGKINAPQVLDDGFDEI